MIARRTCRLVTLGCKVNQYETQYVKEMLEANGYVEAADAEPADLCVVNTCTVTHEGDAKSRQLVRRLHQANPDAALVVMGCYATRDPDAVARLPGDFRVRLSSLEAAEARDDLVRALAEEPRVCPHLHLCLQSGSDRILAAMKRRYRSAGFLERCRRIREALGNPAFSTDVILGF